MQQCIMAAIAAPVFREIATKLYAMYVQKKDPSMYAVKKDSSAYFYAGNTKDIKNVYTTLNVSLCGFCSAK